MVLDKAQKLVLYTNMVRTRKLDELMCKALATGKLPGHWSSQIGQEAVGVGTSSFLKKDDKLLYSHRAHGASTAFHKGVPARAIVAEHYGRSTGCCGGLAFLHTAGPEVGVPGISGTIGGDFVIAAGMGITAKLRGNGQVVVCHQGDGCIGRGTFHETALMAANWNLPIVWVIQNNQYMIYTPTCEIHPKENIADLAFGYGVPGIVVDGQDVFAVHEAVQTAVDRAREGLGPTLIECKTYRIRPHTEGMPDIKINGPRPQEEIDPWKERDPIKLCRDRLLEEGVLTQADINRIDREAAQEMEEADRFATESPITGPEALANALYA